MNEKLEFGRTLQDCITIGTKNLPSILLTVLLWFVTCWIPYLNVGTTIALITLPMKLSRGEVINPTFIFDSVYRHQMGEFFLLAAVWVMGIAIGVLFGYIPGIVLSLAWSQAFFLLLDKRLNWAVCLTESNRLTMGYKLKMFLIKLVLGIIIFFAYIIFAFIAYRVPLLGVLLYVALFIVSIGAFIAIDGVFYRELVLKAGTEEQAPVVYVD